MKTLYGLMIALAVSVLVMKFARADDVKTFPLNKMLEETFVICVVQHDAESIIEADIKNDPSIAKSVVGKCFQLTANVIYTKRAFEKTHNGKYYTVYEAVVQGRRGFVPMIGWRHTVNSI